MWEPRLDEVGERLRFVRHEHCLSLEDVERLTDGEILAPTLSRWENAKRPISLNRLQRLCEVYGEQPLYVLFNVV